MPGHGQQVVRQLGALALGRDDEVAGVEAPGDVDDRADAGGRAPQHALALGGDRGRGGEQQRSGRRRIRRARIDALAEVGGEAGEGRSRGLDRHLLADEGPEDEFVRVEAAGHPDAGHGRDGCREPRVGGEGRVDRHGVGVEVEQASHARDERRQVGEGREARLDVDRRREGVAAGLEPHEGRPAGQPERAGVVQGPGLLDPVERPRREPGEHARGIERRTSGQPQAHDPRMRLEPGSARRRRGRRLARRRRRSAAGCRARAAARPCGARAGCARTPRGSCR